jgi:general secretion pathway protein I
MLGRRSNLIKQKAFTLIEVMAAVAVFAISASGLYTINQQSILLADRLETKTFAHWVALNNFNRMELETELPPSGSESNTEEMAGVEWKVVKNISDTPLKTVRRVTVSVSDENGNQHAQLVGFIGLNKAVALESYQ